MRYAITGATGFVGGALAAQLREAGHEVVALVRDPSRAAALTDLGVELLPGDLDDTAALDRLCTGVDGLFHVAGWYKLGERDPSVGDRVNVAGTRNVLAAALAHGVRRVVYTSTLAVNSDTEEQVVDESYRFTGEHLSHYDRTKAEAHDVALELAAPGPAGRHRAARARLRPRRHRPDRCPDRGGRAGRSAAGAVGGRRLLGPRRRRRPRPRARDGARRTGAVLHARRPPGDARRGPDPGRADRGHQGTARPSRADGARHRRAGRRARARRTAAARTTPRRRCAPRWPPTTARPAAPSTSSAGRPGRWSRVCARPWRRCAAPDRSAVRSPAASCPGPSAELEPGPGAVGQVERRLGIARPGPVDARHDDRHDVVAAAGQQGGPAAVPHRVLACR